MRSPGQVVTSQPQHDMKAVRAREDAAASASQEPAAMLDREQMADARHSVNRGLGHSRSKEIREDFREDFDASLEQLGAAASSVPPCSTACSRLTSKAQTFQTFCLTTDLRRCCTEPAKTGMLRSAGFPKAAFLRYAFRRAWRTLRHFALNACPQTLSRRSGTTLVRILINE